MERLLANYAAPPSAAPAVPVRLVSGDLSRELVTMHNPTAADLFAPVPTAAVPFRASEAQRSAALPSGHVEPHAMEHAAFARAVNEATRGKKEEAAASPAAARPAQAKRAKRHAPDEPASESFLGPWRGDSSASQNGGMSLAQLEELGRSYEASRRGAAAATAAVESEAELPQQTPAMPPPSAGSKKGRQPGGPPAAIPCASVADSSRDYLGRSWVEQGQRATGDVERCYASKARVAAMPKGHSDQVSRLRVHKDGRLLLSTSFDRSAKVWGTQQGRRTCLAEYWGHNKAVKDGLFLGAEQEQFATLGFDQNLCLWQLETGQLLRSIATPAIGFCLGATPSHPDILVGCNDAKIYQYDTRSGSLSIVYDRHLQAVNTITFFDQGRRFISSSDDKTLRYWEFGTPVEIKIHQEPHMHSMPASAVSEKIGFAAFQSMDNQILLYGVSQESGYKLNRKKRYLGHLTAGYSCGLDFSPDGSMIVSGDSEGKLFFWDVVTTKQLRKLQGHQGPVNTVVWHPYQASTVFSGGKDGKILMWD